MASAHLPTGARTVALTAVLLVVGAAPAGAVSQQAAGCEFGAGGRLTCTYRTPTLSPLHIVVPQGVHRAVMTVRGGAGGPGSLSTPVPVAGLSESPGGAGGTASATFALHPGQFLDVRVGGAGQPGAEGGGGGLGGGGNGNTLVFVGLGLAGGGGGGGSEVRFGGANPAGTPPLIAAGGGGGGGSGILGLQVPGAPQLGPGGAGGGTSGEPGAGIELGNGVFGGGGRGGTSTGGGDPGAVVIPGLPSVLGGAGTRGQGGDAGMLTIPKMFEDGIGGGGGGGGGYFGGSGGNLFGGGGGGSGFGPPSATFGTAAGKAVTGVALPDGEVVIAFDPPAGHGSRGAAVGAPKQAARER
ncbi:MAG TPA: glycine-rich protein [Sporichthya sp.]|nr:glycine-rich protein [Sporichthya sp.]